MAQTKARGLATILLVLALASPALAMPTFQSGDEISLSGERSDMAFAAGGNLAFDATITDMLFAAGGELEFTGGWLDTLIASGGEVSFTGTQFGDVIAAGGELTLDGGSVVDDVVLAGGEIEVARDFDIDGSAVIAGGEVTLAGRIGDSATVRAGKITIAGEISGDANLAAEEIVIGPGARIGGNLTHRARKIEISPDAAIVGEVTALPYEPAFSEREVLGFLISGLIIAALIYFVGTSILAMALTALAPGLMAATAARIRSSPLATLGIGLLWAVAAPVVAAILIASLIGMPLGFVIIGLYILAFPFGGTAAVHFVGTTLRGWVGGKSEPRLGGRLGWTLVGALILCLIVLIPFIGPLVWVVAGVMGLGALVAELGRALRAPRSSEAGA